MVNDYVGLPADGSGKKLDSERVTRTIGATPTQVLIERQKAAPPLSPQRAILSGTLAAGAEFDFDCPAIPSAKIGKIHKVIISVSTRFAVNFRTVDTDEDRGVVIINAIGPYDYTPPHEEYETIAAGDQFRLRATNNGGSSGAFYAIVFYDLVPTT